MTRLEVEEDSSAVEKMTCRFAPFGYIKRHVVSVEAPSCRQPQNDMSFSFGNENDMSFPVNTYQPIKAKTTCRFG